MADATNSAPRGPFSLLGKVESAEKAFLAGRRHRARRISRARWASSSSSCLASRASISTGLRHRVRLRVLRRRPSLLPARARPRRGPGEGGLRRHDRGRSGNHGGHESRRPVGGGREPRLQHPAPHGAQAGSLPRPLHRVRALVRAQGDVGQVLDRLRGDARRLRHSRRGVRGHHVDADGQAAVLPAGGYGRRLLDARAELRPRDDGRRGRDQPAGHGSDPARRQRRRRDPDHPEPPGP
jgi:hypothetical protein